MKKAIEAAEQFLTALCERNISKGNFPNIRNAIAIREKLANIIHATQNTEDRNYIAQLMNELRPLTLLSRFYLYTVLTDSSNKVNHKIDWKSINQDTLFKGVHDQFDGEENMSLYKNYESIISKTFIKSDKGRLSVEIATLFDYDPVEFDEIKVLSFRLLDETYQRKKVNRPFPAVFSLAYQKEPNHEEWDLRHRLIEESYRGQQISLNLLNLVEDSLKVRQNERGVQQFITCKTALAPIIFFLLKNGFKPDEELDQERLGRLLSFDPALRIVSSPFNEMATEPLHWNIFEAETLKRFKPEEIWTSDRGSDMHYLSSAFRINFKKSIKV